MIGKSCTLKTTTQYWDKGDPHKWRATPGQWTTKFHIVKMTFFAECSVVISIIISAVFFFFFLVEAGTFILKFKSNKRTRMPKNFEKEQNLSIYSTRFLDLFQSFSNCANIERHKQINGTEYRAQHNHIQMVNWFLTKMWWQANGEKGQSSH